MSVDFNDPESCWDSESRQSPYSTVADPDEEFCETCETDFDAAGKCACDDGSFECDGCRGDGVYYGRGYVENGVFKGFTGTCYRCGGKGTQTAADVKRNNYYDNHVRRYAA